SARTNCSPWCAVSASTHNVRGKNSTLNGCGTSGSGRAAKRSGRDETVHADDLERGAGDGLEGAEGGVVPAGVGRAADVPAAAVVGEEHAVGLEGGEDDADFGGEGGDVEVGAEPDAHAHGREVGIGAAAGPVGGGRDVGAAGGRAGEAERVTDLAAFDDLVVADEAGGGGEAGGCGGGPGGGSEGS